MYGGIVSRDDDNARPLLDEHAALFERERGSWTLGRVTRYAGATAIGALVVAAGFIASDPSHPALQKFRGLSVLGAESGAAAPAIHRAATRRAAPTPAHHHRLGSPDADAVGRLGGDDIAHIDALDEQVARLTRELTAARSENVELEKQVQSLEQSIVDTREEFLKIGHGGRSKHLAGSHDNEIIADLENQLKDKHYELEKTRQQKYKLYIKNNECNAAQAELDKTIADCNKNMFEYAERADALERMERCSAEKAALTTKLSTANEKLETALADLAAARVHHRRAQDLCLLHRLAQIRQRLGVVRHRAPGKVEARDVHASLEEGDELGDRAGLDAQRADDLRQRRVRHVLGRLRGWTRTRNGGREGGVSGSGRSEARLLKSARGKGRDWSREIRRAPRARTSTICASPESEPWPWLIDLCTRSVPESKRGPCFFKRSTASVMAPWSSARRNERKTAPCPRRYLSRTGGQPQMASPFIRAPMTGVLSFT